MNISYHSTNLTKVSLIETELLSEELYNKNQTMVRLRTEFYIPEITDHCTEHQIPVDFAVDLLAQMVLHKRATMSMLVGILHRHFMVDPKDTPEVRELQACVDMIEHAAACQLVDWIPLANQFVLRIDVSADVYEDLERYQYPLPMVVAPAIVRTNTDTGYLCEGSKRGSLILQGGHHDGDLCLDHINRVNQTKLSVNVDVVSMIQNKWRDLDHQKLGETRDEYLKRLKAFEKYDRVSRDVIDHLLMLGNVFHLTHRYDKRGRCYAQGYHVNPQGNDWNKACVEFAQSELVEL